MIERFKGTIRFQLGVTSQGFAQDRLISDGRAESRLARDFLCKLEDRACIHC